MIDWLIDWLRFRNFMMWQIEQTTYKHNKIGISLLQNYANVSRFDSILTKSKLKYIVVSQVVIIAPQ